MSQLKPCWLRMRIAPPVARPALPTVKRSLNSPYVPTTAWSGPINSARPISRSAAGLGCRDIGVGRVGLEPLRSERYR